MGDVMNNTKSETRVLDKPAKSANSSHYKKESRTADWVAAVAMVAEKSKAKAKESKKPLREDASVKDIDVARARSLSSQI